MCAPCANTSGEKANVIPRQNAAGFLLSLCGDMVNFGGNCRHIAANCCD
jgi:hypothetical protein